MKWKVEPRPVDGDVKVVKCFALFPHRIACEDVVVWLTHYYELRRFVRGFSVGPHWIPSRWVVVAESEHQITVEKE